MTSRGLASDEGGDPRLHTISQLARKGLQKFTQYLCERPDMATR
jgi:hypothetical protein